MRGALLSLLLVAACSVPIVVPGPARAGEITATGFRMDRPGGTYITLGWNGYVDNVIPVLYTTEQGPSTIGTGYRIVDGSSKLLPGDCVPFNTPAQWTCGLVGGLAGEPLVITGHAGDDSISESGCAHAAEPAALSQFADGAPCPRTFHYEMGAGNDLVQITTPNVDEGRLPSDGIGPAAYFVMRDTLVDGGPGRDQLLVRKGRISGTARMGTGIDFVNTALSLGSFTISCGADIDIVRAGADDRVGADCERVNGNTRPRARADTMRPAKRRAALVLRPLANDVDGGTGSYEEAFDDDTEGAPLRIARLARTTCGTLKRDRRDALRFIPPARGCPRPQRLTYTVTDGLLISQPTQIRLPAVKPSAARR